METFGSDHRALATQRHCLDRIEVEWPRFLKLRADRLRHGGESEKVAEGILEDLFTGVLDWTRGDLNYQVGFADVVVSHNLIKYLVIEVKRPGTLYPGRRALEHALGQAWRYASEQRISRIAASDGRYFYAADIEGGGLKPRTLVDLAMGEPSPSLWWVSVHGVYRPCAEAVSWAVADEPSPPSGQNSPTDGLLLHPKYALPASCFAYVGDASDPSTWKLPFLLIDGHPDERRLPKAIQALLSNYRGAKVGGIPEQAIADVLAKLAHAAASMGKLPPYDVNPAPAYQQLVVVLDQLGIPRP